MTTQEQQEVIVQASRMIQQLAVFIEKDGSIRGEPNACFDREVFEEYAEKLKSINLK